jgi:hypothetical protein
MGLVCRPWLLALALLAMLSMSPGAASQERVRGASPADTPPGRPASREVVAEIQQALDAAIRRFNAKDAPGVLAFVSERYRTGPLTKAAVADQLYALFALHDEVTARVRIDSVRMVGDTAWVYTTGDVAGRPRWMSRSLPVFAWERELEVARREPGGWRLFGYQQ